MWIEPKELEFPFRRTEPVLAEGVQTAVQKNRHSLDPALSRSERAMQRLRIFIQDAQMLVAEDLAALQEPLQACREVCLDQTQQTQLNRIEAIAAELQTIVAQHLTTMDLVV